MVVLIVKTVYRWYHRENGENCIMVDIYSCFAQMVRVRSPWCHGVCLSILARAAVDISGHSASIFFYEH